MASFLQYQEQARKRTRWLVLLYALCLALLAATLYGLGLTALRFAPSGGGARLQSDGKPEPWQPGLLTGVLGGLALVVGGATLVKRSQLASGGPAVAESVGGRRVPPNTRAPEERRLMNVVEEMAIAAGVAVPAVYVLDKERGINAFAAGWSPDDAAVAVTAGALANFNREELQAVVGHEFSHILNGDMRLNIRMIATIFGLVCLSLFGRVVVRAGAEALRSKPRSGGKGEGAAAFLLVMVGIMGAGLAIWLLGTLGELFGRLMQATISRQREFLADASSVQFTRNPQGMANALKVIGALAGHGRVRHPAAAALSHMFFAPAVAGAFATHPPIEERIRRYEPGFQGDYAETLRIVERRRRLRQAAAAGDNDDGDWLERELPRRRFWTLLAAAAKNPAARPTPLPRPVLDAAAIAPLLAEPGLRDPAVAPAILCAALVDGRADIAERQRELVRRVDFDGTLLPAVDAWTPRLGALRMRECRAVCEVAASALRAASPAHNKRIGALLERLVMADDQVTAFEFALLHIFKSRLLPPATRRLPSSDETTDALAVLLGAVAFLGAGDTASRVRAYEEGLAAVLPKGTPFPAWDPDGYSFAAVEGAMNLLRNLPPAAREGVMRALERTVLADGAVLEDEENLLAAIAVGIDATGYASLLPVPTA